MSTEHLKPCPFCGGPPVPIVTRAGYPWGALYVKDIDLEEGTDADGYVFCHECGARGPCAEECVGGEASYKLLEAEGVRLWQERDDHNGDLYRSGEDAGLNDYPRADG